MKRILTIVFAFAIALGGAAVSQAEPGPNGNNDKGLCTAYFNGQKNGHDKQREGEDGAYPRPFAALEEAGNDETDTDGRDNDRDGQTDEANEHESLSPAENIYNFCQGLIGGNPEHGRYTCSDPGASSDPECTENEAPGKS
jgi:hypothetical protein